MHIAYRSLSFWSHRLAVLGARSLPSLLAALIRTSTDGAEDPIESAPLLFLLLFFFFFFSKLNRILEGLNMLEKSGNFAHASELVKIYVWYGFQEVGVAKWLDSATYKYSAECASSYVSRTCTKIGTLM